MTTKNLEDMNYIELQQLIRRERIAASSNVRCAADIATGEQCVREQAYVGGIGLAYCKQHYRQRAS